MPNELTLLQRLEKNRLYSNGAWLALLDITINNTYNVKVCNNNEDITYEGNVYYAFPFSMDVIALEDSKGETNDITLKVSNLTGIIMNYIEMSEGAKNSTITIAYINSKHLDEPAAFRETMKISSISYDDSWVELKLSANYITSFRIPMRTYKRDFCDYQFKGIECGYNGSETACNHSLKRCRELHNEIRYGGEPTIGSGFYVDA
jgi:phage-related protein